MPNAAPITRRPGQHAFHRADHLILRLICLLLICLLALILAGLLLDFRGLALVVIELALIALMVGVERRRGAEIERWLQGARGECKVGAILDRLPAEEWNVLHDVSLGRGNIDHLLIGRAGIFTIETKSHRGRVRVDRIDSRMLKQAYAQRMLLERITGYRVQPLLVFSDAWLAGHVPASREGVLVIPARMLERYLRRQCPLVSADRARSVHRRLAAAIAATSTAPSYTKPPLLLESRPQRR